MKVAVSSDETSEYALTRQFLGEGSRIRPLGGIHIGQAGALRSLTEDVEELSGLSVEFLR